MPDAVTIQALAAVRRTLEALRAHWRSITPKGTLEIHFDPAACAMRPEPAL